MSSELREGNKSCRNGVGELVLWRVIETCEYSFAIIRTDVDTQTYKQCTSHIITVSN